MANRYKWYDNYDVFFLTHIFTYMYSMINNNFDPVSSSEIFETDITVRKMCTQPGLLNMNIKIEFDTKMNFINFFWTELWKNLTQWKSSHNYVFQMELHKLHKAIS